MKTHPQRGGPTQRQENAELRGVLQQLIGDATHNQRVMTRFQERELALLRATDLPSLLRHLTAGMRETCALDDARLVLLDPFYVLRDLLAVEAVGDAQLARDVELCTDVPGTLALFEETHDPWLGAWQDARHRPLFGRRPGGSVALLPLRQADGLAGFLCLASRDRERFRPDQASDFLAHLAAVTAVCLENAVNRERLRLVGLTDSLTGLYNRRHLEHRLAQEVHRARRYAQSLACLFVDADHFKRINDRHGHPAGDQVLVALAQHLRTRLRASDLATRYGGEEFAVLLPQTDADSAYTLAQQICDSVAATPITLDNGTTLQVTVSIGVAAMDGAQRGPDADGSDLLAAADQAVYRAKAAGRNCVAVHGNGQGVAGKQLN